MKQKIFQYEKTITDFVQKQRGCFIVLSHDQTFLAVLRTVLTKNLALVAADMILSVQETGKLTKVIKQAEGLYMYPFLFIERSFKGQDTAPLIRQLREAFPKLFIVVLTIDVEKYRIMYLHELGVDNFITKPVSASTIIEKIAFTIKPQNKLGELIDQAKKHLEAGEIDKAKALSGKILGIKPGSAAGLMVLGDAEAAAGNMDAAREAYLEASQNADLYLEPLRKLAELAERTGDLEEALKYLGKLNKLSPLNSERKIEMGEIHLELGNDDRAEELFNAAITQISNDAMEHIAELATQIAKIYEKENPVRAEAYIRKALNAKSKNLTKEDMRLFNKLGVALRKQGKWQDAVLEYRRALEIDPCDDTIYYNMGMAYAESENFSEALKCMEKALSFNSDLPYISPGVAYNVGMVMFRSARREEARRCFEAALEQNPDFGPGKEALKKLQA